MHLTATETLRARGRGVTGPGRLLRRTVVALPVDQEPCEHHGPGGATLPFLLTEVAR